MDVADCLVLLKSRRDSLVRSQKLWARWIWASGVVVMVEDMVSEKVGWVSELRGFG